MQLVVSVTDIPSAEAQVLIEQAMAKVEALDIHLRNLSAGQIYTILQVSQLEIMKILDEDGKIPATAPPTTTPPAQPPAQPPSSDAPQSPVTEPPAASPPEVEPSGAPSSEPSTSEAPAPGGGGTDPAPAPTEPAAPSEPAQQTVEPEPGPRPSRAVNPPVNRPLSRAATWDHPAGADRACARLPLR